MAKKRKPKPTEIMVILDRSGSMTAIRDDTIGGFNTFLAEQKKLGGKCWLSLLQFDHELGFVHEGVPIADVPPLDETTFIPRGMTALLDAMMRGIGCLAERAGGKKGRLAHVVILTDGIENASRETTVDQVFAEVEKRKKEGWAIQYLGAGQDAIEVAAGLGVDRTMAATYAGTGETTRKAFSATSRAAKSFRSSGLAKDSAYSGSERSAMAGDDIVSASEAAQELGVSKRTLDRMAAQKRGPRPIRPSGAPAGRRAYRRQDIKDWLAGK